MHFSFVSIFNDFAKAYFEDALLARAIKNKLISTSFYDPRDFTKNKYKKVDDYLIGGGAGLLLAPKPLCACLAHIYALDKEAYFIFLCPTGKPFIQNDAKRLAKKKHICFVSGRYEGFDERIIELFAKEIFSIGDFIITGGELASLCLADAIARNIKGVLGNERSLEEESFEELLEAPKFTKPKDFRNILAPSEFLKGNHAKIASLKNKLALCKSSFHRPDLAKRKKNEK